MSDERISEDEALRRKALLTVGSACCIEKHQCDGPGCRSHNHRRDIAYWREMADMLGLAK